MCVALCLDISSLVSILCQAMTGTDDTDAKLAPKKSCNKYIYTHSISADMKVCGSLAVRRNNATEVMKLS
jgi:hypothetical protein